MSLIALKGFSSASIVGEDLAPTHRWMHHVSVLVGRRPSEGVGRSAEELHVIFVSVDYVDSAFANKCKNVFFFLCLCVPFARCTIVK